MKKISFLLLIVFILFSACGKEYSFRGVSYRFNRTSDSFEKAVSLNSLGKSSPSPGEEYFSTPQEVNVAFSKILFPTVGDANQIFNTASNHELQAQQIPIGSNAYGVFRNHAILAYESSLNDPMIISIDDAELISLDTNSIADEDRFWGIILQTVYYEFKMSDFSIRWYANNSGIYQAKDVLLSRDNGLTWRYAYNQVAVDTSDGQNIQEYSLLLSSSRQTDIYLQDQGNAGDQPENGDIMSMSFFYQQEWDDYGTQGGSLDPRTMLMTFGKASTDQAGGGFGRLDNTITGFSITVSYDLGEQTNGGGLRMNFSPSQSGSVRYSDISTVTDFPKKLYPTKQLSFDVIYQIKEEDPVE